MKNIVFIVCGKWCSIEHKGHMALAVHGGNMKVMAAVPGYVTER